MPIFRKLRFPVKKLMIFCRKKEKTGLLYLKRKGNLAKRNDLSSVFLESLSYVLFISKVLILYLILRL